jgi:hypothetical protein
VIKIKNKKIGGGGAFAACGAPGLISRLGRALDLMCAAETVVDVAGTSSQKSLVLVQY